VEDTPIGPRRPRIHLAPTTRAGLWAARLLVPFLAGVVVYISLAATYQIVTGEEAFDNLRVPLVTVLLTTEVAGVLAGMAAVLAVFRRGERSALAFLALIVLVFTAIVIVLGSLSD
jgi:hypothetical protein